LLLVNREPSLLFSAVGPLLIKLQVSASIGREAGTWRGEFRTRNCWSYSVCYARDSDFDRALCLVY
jgi:hypothetical protein